MVEAPYGANHLIMRNPCLKEAGEARLMLEASAERPGPLGTMRGSIDIANREMLQGWVRYDGEPDTPVSLIVSVDGVQIARVLANAYRADLEVAGLGTGRHAFSVHLHNISPLVPCTLRVQREQDGADIPGSPIALRPAQGFDDVVQDQLARFLSDCASDDDVKRRLSFLAEQMERLFHLRAERHSDRNDRERRAQLDDRWSNGVRQPRQHALRALVIDGWTPVKNRDAGSNAITSHMLSLQRLGYAVSFVPADMQPSLGTAEIEGCDIICHTRPWSGSVEEVIRRQVDCFDIIYVHRLANACYLPFIRSFQRRARVIFSVADLASLRLSRQADVEARPELRRTSAQLAASEIAVMQSVDAVLTHSPHEAELLCAQLPARKVHVVPWSVPLAPASTPFAERTGLAFVGNYAHPPNTDAAFYLVQEVMPLVWEQDPGITCTLAGSSMPPSVQALAGPRVTIAGHVADLSALLGQVRLTAAPLTFGAGVKGKVLDSLAAGVPCVCSPVAAEGIDLPSSLRAGIGATPVALARAIHQLHSDGACHAHAARDGLALIAANYQESQVDAALAACLGRVHA